MKKFKVTVFALHECEAVVEAETKGDAINSLKDAPLLDFDTDHLIGYDDWKAEEVL